MGRRGMEVDHRIAAREVRGSNPTAAVYFRQINTAKSSANSGNDWMDARASICARA